MATMVLLRNCQIFELYGINKAKNYDETKYLLHAIPSKQVIVIQLYRERHAFPSMSSSHFCYYTIPLTTLDDIEPKLHHIILIIFDFPYKWIFFFADFRMKHLLHILYEPFSQTTDC